MQKVQPAVPKRGTPEYEWWAKGAEDEAHARWEDVHPDDREAIELLQAMAEARHVNGRVHTRVELLRDALSIYMAGMSRSARLRVVWRLLR